MKLSISLTGTLFALGGLAGKEALSPDKVEADIKTEAWVFLPSDRILAVSHAGS